MESKQTIKKWYVYVLIDPRDKKVFYVGKGQRYRMYYHLWLTKKNKVSNNNFKLFRKIKDIIDNGYDIEYNKCFLTNNEIEAYQYERKIIQEIGIKNLCNIFDGVGCVHSGKNHWNYGKKWSDDVKNKISKSKLGDFHCDKTKRKLKNYWSHHIHPFKGKFHNDETKRKMSQNHADFKGHKNPFFGKKHKESTKQTLKNMNICKWIITFPNNTTMIFNGKEEIYNFINEYNNKYNKKVSLFSIFQYKKNKEGWALQKQ